MGKPWGGEGRGGEDRRREAFEEGLVAVASSRMLQYQVGTYGVFLPLPDYW